MPEYRVFPQVSVAITASLGAFLFGIACGWSAPSQLNLLSPESDFKMTTNEFSWATAAMPLGAALSLIVSGLFRDRFGTKVTIAVSGVSHLAGWILLVFASKPMMVIAGRLLIGTACGAYSFVVPVYIGEFASKEIRGVLGTLFQVFLESGILFVYSYGSLVSLSTLNMTCAIFVIIYTFTFTLLPESPLYLMQRGKQKKAENCMKLLRGRTYNSKLEIEELNQALLKASKAPKSSFIAEFGKRENFKAFLIIVCIFLFFQMSGINAVTYYTTTIFQNSGITNISPSTATIILGFVQVIATTATAPCIDRYGRTFMLMVSFVMMILGLVTIATYFYGVTDFFDWVPVPALCIFVIGFSVGIGPIPNILLGEIFSSGAKKFVAPLAQTVSLLMAFGVGLMYPRVADELGYGPTFLVFAGFCLAGLMFTILFVPETKGKSLQEIQEILSG